MKYRGRRWAAFAAMIGLILSGYFAWREYRRPTINVLLITLDTTRADHLGCYGNPDALTPALDGLAKRGVLWEHARTPIPLTLPTHASLFTGLYPAEHGLRSNGIGRMSKSIPTLAERLSAAGYDTGAFVASIVLNEKFGLQRGFAFYDDDLPTVDPTRNVLERQRDGRLVVESALDWLNRPRRGPFFCWVHFYDAHHPYLPRADEFGERFETRPYDGEIAYVDTQVQRLLDNLKDRGLTDRTLVIVVGDHGEGLGDHGEREHGLTLYDQGLHVPWIWAGPQIATGVRIGQPVCLTDFTPTMLDALGLRSLPGISGRSLWAGLLGQDVSPGVCYSATDDPLLGHGCAPLRSFATERWKYIRGAEPELYDLAADPKELHNLAEELPDQLAELEFEMSALERRLALREADNAIISAKDRQALSGLGYLSGTSVLPVDRQVELPDIKGRLALFDALEDARELHEQGNSALAAEQMREILQQAPNYSLVSLRLADVLNRLGEFEVARRELQKVLEREPDNLEAHYRLAGIYLTEKHVDKALAQFNHTLHDPPRADDIVYIGQLLVQLGQPAKGRDYFERALTVDPRSSEAHLSLGTLDLSDQRPRDAEQHYRQALRGDSRSIEAHLNLIRLLGAEQKFSEALPYAAAARQLSPANVELRFLHGTLLMALNKLPDAKTEFEAACRLDPHHAQARQFLSQVQEAMGHQ